MARGRGSHGRGRGRGQRGRGRGRKRSNVIEDHVIPDLDPQGAGPDNKKTRFESDSSDFESEEFLREPEQSEQSEQSEVEVANSSQGKLIHSSQIL